MEGFQYQPHNRQLSVHANHSSQPLIHYFLKLIQMRFCFPSYLGKWNYCLLLPGYYLIKQRKIRNQTISIQILYF